MLWEKIIIHYVRKRQTAGQELIYKLSTPRSARHCELVGCPVFTQRLSVEKKCNAYNSKVVVWVGADAALKRLGKTRVTQKAKKKTKGGATNKQKAKERQSGSDSDRSRTKKYNWSADKQTES